MRDFPESGPHERVFWAKVKDLRAYDGNILPIYFRHKVSSKNWLHFSKDYLSIENGVRLFILKASFLHSLIEMVLKTRM